MIKVPQNVIDISQYIDTSKYTIWYDGAHVRLSSDTGRLQQRI